jgi:lantibiotic modifying enzyme
MGFSSMFLQKYLVDENFTQDIYTAINLVGKNYYSDICLCHGDLGNHDLLLENVLRTKTDFALDLYTKYTDNLLYRIKEFGIKFQLDGTLPLPGLMGGLGGLAYQMLRIAKPNLVPSILLIDN